MNDAAAPPPFVPGSFPDMPADTYHAIEAMSSGGIKKMVRSPGHYRVMRTTTKPSTPDQQFGTSVHCAVLEPVRFPELVALTPPVNKRTIAGREAWALALSLNPGRILLDPDDYERVIGCAAAIRAHPAASYLLDGATCETSLFWNDGKYGVPCKARPDVMNHRGMVDVKTIDDASPDAFARRVASNLWHVQAAHYISGSEHVLAASPDFYAFVAVEVDPPHFVAVYELPTPAILAGMHQANIALERYQRALANGTWDGYPATMERLPFPRYALRFNQ